MRLTLRTLLGYLDDILEPSQAKEIGEKISESPKAAALVSRIRDVLRRRRIEAPALMGPGSEPDSNLVAEYLDNTLSPDKVEELERICFESDVHLAEVGAAHQILTLVLGEQVDVSSELRERMHSLGAIATDSATNVSAVASTSVAASPVATPPKPLAPKHEIPEYLRRDSGMKKLIPFIVLGIAAIVWVAIVSNDPTRTWKFWESHAPSQVSNAEAAANLLDSQDPSVAKANPPSERVAPGVRPSTPVIPPPPAASGEGTDNAVAMTRPNLPNETSINPPPPGDLPEPGTTPAPTTPVVPGDPVAMVTPPTTPVPAVPMPVEPMPDHGDGVNVAVPPGVAWPKVLYSSADGLLLRHDSAGAWLLMPRRAMLHAGEEVACLEPYGAQIDVENQYGVSLHGGARLTLQPGPKGGAGLQLDRGRVVLRRADVAAAELPVVISIMMYGDRYQLSLLEPETLCGIEVRPQISMAAPAQPQRLTFDGGLYVTQGKVALENQQGESVTLTADAGWVQFVGGSPAFQPSSPAASATWVTGATPEPPSFTRAINRQFEESFSSETPVSETIPALLDDRHPRVAEIASLALALIGDEVGMVRGLSSNHEEARLAAIRGLGLWIRRQNDNQQRLTDLVELRWREADATAIIRLIWGFNSFDAQNPTTSKELIDWMGHEDIAVRELAFFHVQRLTNRTYSFRSQNSLPQRHVSLERWKDHLKREGALVAPSNPPAAGGAP